MKAKNTNSSSLKIAKGKSPKMQPGRKRWYQRFFKSIVLVVREFKRVRWANWKTLRRSFFKIIVFTFIFALFVYGLTTLSILIIGQI